MAVAAEWLRSADNEVWCAIEGASQPRYVITAADLSCWLFAEWRYIDGEGQIIAEGTTEGTDWPVRLQAEVTVT